MYVVDMECSACKGTGVRKTEKRFRENPLPTGPLVEQYTVAWPCVWCGGKGLVTVSSENVFEPAALEDFEF